MSLYHNYIIHDGRGKCSWNALVVGVDFQRVVSLRMENGKSGGRNRKGVETELTGRFKVQALEEIRRELSFNHIVQEGSKKILTSLGWVEPLQLDLIQRSLTYLKPNLIKSFIRRFLFRVYQGVHSRQDKVGWRRKLNLNSMEHWSYLQNE